MKAAVIILFHARLCLLLLLAQASFPAQLNAADPVRAPATPGQLLDIWKEYDLPLPPAEAPLVKFSTGIRRIENDGTEKPYFSLGFLLEPSASNNESNILAGWSRLPNQNGLHAVIEKIEPKASAMKGVHLSVEAGLSGPNVLLGVAVQCEARGWHEFSTWLLAMALRQSAGHHFSAEAQPEGMHGVDSVYTAVWQFLRSQAMTPGANRAPIARKMKRLLDTGHNLPREGGKWLYEATHAAAQPGKGKAGTPAALVDALVDSKKNGGAIGVSNTLQDDPYFKLELLGFTAVPQLIEHLDDPRLTCATTVGFNNFPSWPRRVSDLVSDLLQDLSGGELDANWLDRQTGGTVRKVAVLEWWKSAQKQGEEAFLVKHALAQINKEDTFPNTCHLRIIQARFPQRLAEVATTQMMQYPKAQLHPILTAIQESTLPTAEKKAIFRQAVQHSNPETRRNGLMEIVKIDPELFRVEAIKAFEKMKAKASGPYWTCAEANLAHLALRTEDERVWTAFLEATKRAETGLRMELMNPLNYTYVGKVAKKQRLQFLRAFLDDTAERRLPDNPDEGKFSGPCAAFTIPRLRVCDFAAMQAASILEWSDAPDKTWTLPQWEKLRSKVRQELVERAPSK